MPTTTPNFGWSVPVSTDLVKDGATAIELLGDSIDASLVDLKGGTTGQVLTKASGTDMDFTFTTPTDQIPLTTKGDLLTFDTADARLGVGANGTVLTADSAEATGLKWATPAAGGGLTLINTGGTTLSGSSTSVTSIPGTFKNLFVVIDKAYVSSDSDNPGLAIRFNGDTGSNYTYQTINSINTSLSGRGDATNSQYEISARVSDQNTDIKKTFIQLTVRNYTNTDGVGFSSSANAFNSSEQPVCTIGSGSYDGSAAITSISIRPTGSGTLSGGTIFVYGEN
jgi:hypothetical protein